MKKVILILVMKSQFIKLIALMALLTAASFACTNETDDYNMVSIKIKCAFSDVVDTNIVSFALPGIVEAVCFKDPPNNGGFPKEMNHDFHTTWTIHLTMAEGTERSKLAPIITLTPGASITLVYAYSFDIYKKSEWKLIAQDGSTVNYSVGVFFIGDPVSFIILDDDGNQTEELVYPGDPRYPYGV